MACSPGRVSTRFGEGGGQLDRRPARGVLYLNPHAIAIAIAITKIKDANWGVLGGNIISDHTVCFHPTRAIKDRQVGKILGAFFRDARGFGRLDTGSRAGFNASRPPPP